MGKKIRNLKLKRELKIAHENIKKEFNAIYFNIKTIRSLRKKLRAKNTKYCGRINRLKRKYGISEDADILALHYIATTIGGMSNGTSSVGSSHELIKKTSKNHSLVTAILDGLPSGITLGAKFGAENNILGKCAEVKVAGNLLNKGIRIPDFKEMSFTEATRPRTQQEYFLKNLEPKDKYIIPRCENCKRVFG